MVEYTHLTDDKDALENVLNGQGNILTENAMTSALILPFGALLEELPVKKLQDLCRTALLKRYIYDQLEPELRSHCEIYNENPSLIAQVYRFEVLLYMMYKGYQAVNSNATEINDLRERFRAFIINPSTFFAAEEIPDNKYGFLFQFASGIG